MDQIFARIDRMNNNQPSHIDYDHQGMGWKFSIPSYSRFYNGEKYFDWEMAVE